MAIRAEDQLAHYRHRARTAVSLEEYKYYMEEIRLIQERVDGERRAMLAQQQAMGMANMFGHGLGDIQSQRSFYDTSNHVPNKAPAPNSQRIKFDGVTQKKELMPVRVELQKDTDDWLRGTAR